MVFFIILINENMIMLVPNGRQDIVITHFWLLLVINCASALSLPREYVYP